MMVALSGRRAFFRGAFICLFSTLATACLPPSGFPGATPPAVGAAGDAVPQPPAQTGPLPPAPPGAYLRATPINRRATADKIHVVAAGETLNSLGRLYRMPPARIAAANQLALDAPLEAGRRLTIPGAGAQRTAEVPPAADPPVLALDAQRPREDAPPQGGASEAALQDRPRVEEAPVQPRRSSATFRWPVRGRVISGFGQETNPGQRNDGVNLAVPEGTPVKAAENGVVDYVGDQVQAYGNMVVVRHEGDFVTAYAHVSEILVRRGDTVQRGQIIAKAGRTGNVNQPQLHFEIKRGRTPVNPVQHLEEL